MVWSSNELIAIFMGMEEAVTMTTLQPAVMRTNYKSLAIYYSEVECDRFWLTIIAIISEAMLSVVKRNAPV